MTVSRMRLFPHDGGEMIFGLEIFFLDNVVTVN